MFPSHAESIAATVKNRDINIHISGFRGKDKSDSTQLVGNKCKVPSLPISLRASCFIDDNNNGIYEALLCHPCWLETSVFQQNYHGTPLSLLSVVLSLSFL